MLAATDICLTLGASLRAQARQGLDATKKRVSESEKRIDSALEPFIKKNYWCARHYAVCMLRKRDLL